jgi:manganese/iron transport system ATP-binding protein
VIYRNGNKAHDGASFSVPKGSITALVGINGSGKSTLFKSLMGFVPLASGEISIMGQSVQQALRRNLVAYVPQAKRSTGRSRCWSKTWS